MSAPALDLLGVILKEGQAPDALAALAGGLL
jgi:hypothetical protein